MQLIALLPCFALVEISSCLRSKGVSMDIEVADLDGDGAFRLPFHCHSTMLSLTVVCAPTVFPLPFAAKTLPFTAFPLPAWPRHCLSPVFPQGTRTS